MITYRKPFSLNLSPFTPKKNLIWNYHLYHPIFATIFGSDTIDQFSAIVRVLIYKEAARDQAQ
jgi:hypothetical protein